MMKKKRQPPDTEHEEMMEPPEEEAGETPEEEAAEHRIPGKTQILSRKRPNEKIGKGTAEVETGTPADRLKGYRKGWQTGFTGSDARAALVGSMKKPKRPSGFPKTSKSY